MSNAPDSDFRFLRKYRLRLRTEFDAVYEHGVVAADSVLVIHAVRNGLVFTRIGLAITKRAGTAPIRNRWKRWMREAFRLRRLELPSGLDVVIRTRRGAEGSFQAVERSMLKLLQELDRRLPPAGFGTGGY